jgi:RNA-directed DNA polymerase
MQGERWKPTVVRYADDFVVLHPDKAVIEQTQQLVSTWLSGMELTLKPSKTHLTHTLIHGEEPAGFDFLGFHIQQYPVGKTHSGKGRHGQPLGFKTIITPSVTAMKRHQETLKERIRKYGMLSQTDFIKRLNPLIAGWSRYYSSVSAKRSFTHMDTYLFHLLWQWGKRRHPNKSATWRAKNYWHPERGRWQFASSEGSLRLHRHTPITRYVKVQGTKSPFDGDWIYWTKRQGKHPETPPKMASLLKRQKGCCASCGLSFKDGDRLEIDHRLPRAIGGTDQLLNLQLLHRHCHDQKTATDGSRTVRGTDDNSQTIEEPDEVTNLTSGFEAERRGQPRRLG